MEVTTLTMNTTVSSPWYNTHLQKATFSAYIILLLIGTVGNSLVVICVALNKMLHNPTFAAIASLAVADFLFLCWRIPMEILHILNKNWISGTTVCKMSFLVYQLTSYSAAYHLVLLSAIRFYSLVYPFQALQHLTVRRSCIMCGVLWVSVFICISPVLFTSGIVEQEFNGRVYVYCAVETTEPLHASLIYSCLYAVFSYFIPLFMITVLHVTKVYRVTRMSREMSPSYTHQLSSMVVVVLLLFGGLLLPVHLKNILILGGVSVLQRMPELDLVCRCMAYANSCINPYVYAFFSKQFRRSLTRMLPCCKAEEVSPMHGGRSGNVQTTSTNVQTTSA